MAQNAMGKERAKALENETPTKKNVKKERVKMEGNLLKFAE